MLPCFDDPLPPLCFLDHIYMDAWTSYFSELGNLLRDSNRQYGIASANLTEHFMERFELAVQSCTSVVGFLENVELLSLTQHEQSVAQEYLDLLRQLCGRLRFLLDQWKEYGASLESSTRSNSYHTPVIHTGSQGRPRFVTKLEL
jgi:DNA-binding transcriptional regulator YbjK